MNNKRIATKVLFYSFFHLSSALLYGCCDRCASNTRVSLRCMSLRQLVTEASESLTENGPREALEEIARRRDPNVVPLLLDMIGGNTNWTFTDRAFQLIAEMGDKRCYPYLVPIADRDLDANMSPELYVAPAMSPVERVDRSKSEYESLVARYCIYKIANSDSRMSWPVWAVVGGVSIDRLRAMASYQRFEEEWRQINNWYHEWRLRYRHVDAAGYRPAIEAWGNEAVVDRRPYPCDDERVRTDIREKDVDPQPQEQGDSWEW